MKGLSTQDQRRIGRSVNKTERQNPPSLGGGADARRDRMEMTAFVTPVSNAAGGGFYNATSLTLSGDPIDITANVSADPFTTGVDCILMNLAEEGQATHVLTLTPMTRTVFLARFAGITDDGTFVWAIDSNVFGPCSGGG